MGTHFRGEEIMTGSQARPARLRTLTIAAAMAAGIAAAHADPVIIQGSTTFNRQLMEIYEAVIEAQSNHNLTVIPSKTRPGMIALLEGRAHMAMISTPLENEVEALKNLLPGLAYDRLQAHEIMTTRIAVAVHPSNPVRKATRDELRRILRGQIGNWSQLGGPDLPLRVVLVGGGGGVTSTTQNELLDGETVRGPHVIFVKTGLQVVQVLEQEPSAVGFAQVSLIKERALPEIVSERPIEQSLSLVTIGDPTPAMRSVIDAARQIVEKMM